MKICRLIVMLITMGFFLCIVSGAGDAQTLPSAAAGEDKAKVRQAEAGYLENIQFEKLKGKERVVLMLTRQSGASAVNQGDRAVMLRVENIFVPQELQRAMGEGSLDNLVRVTPAQRTEGGNPQAIINMELKKRVPFSIRQEGHNVIVDFNVAALAAQTVAADKEIPGQAAAGKAPVAEQKTTTEQKPESRPDVAKPPHTGKLITVDFQEASIKSVLRLLAEESGVNIVSGDDVKGNITISMKRVPWEQALDTILGITSMVKRQQGNTITVMTMKRQMEDEKARKDAEEERRKGEEARRKEEQQLREEEGRRRQISIEAKIIEATDDFVRKLGVQWGAGFTDNLRVNKGLYPYGILAGANPIGTSPFGALVGLAQGVALTPGNLAANFPMATAAPSFALGMTIASSYAVLDAEILAAESTSDVRIISSPKVTTMDGAKAVIKQGEDVPIITPPTAQNPATVTFKEAVLKLEVTPKITPDGRISMDVTANNDFPDYARAAQLQGNPPISKSQVTSKVVVTDGETMVVGGILKASTTKGQSGLPWISKVPILGWLFKYESLVKQRKQLLIFITPKLIKPETASPQTIEAPRG